MTEPSEHPIVRELRGYGAEHDARELEAKLRPKGPMLTTFDREVRLLVMHRVRLAHGGLYSGPGGYERFQRDRPADAERYRADAVQLALALKQVRGE